MADNKKKDENLLMNLAHLRKRALDVKFDLDLTEYQPIENIGIGAYGVVCSAVHKKTNDRVAIKKIPNVFDVRDIAKRTYREIKILKHFKHDNIIHIREILKPKETLSDFRDVYVVFDLMESDLHKIIYSKQDLTEEHVRYFLYQILRGMKYIHSSHVIHRDLKPSNLLVNEDCQLRIGDFGMARGISSCPVEPNYFMTQYVATRWYRAPEIMLSLIEYGAAVDMWSVGCIFAEMLGRKHLFPGKDAISQIKLVVGTVGSPNENLLGLCHSPIIKNFFQEMGPKAPIPLPKLFPKASKKAIYLLNKMLVLHPKDRITVEQALVHPYLNKYHDPDDEPICVPAFNFDFEKEELSVNQIREVIVKEVMEYHQPRTPTLSFNALLRPVPKASDAADTSSPFFTKAADQDKIQEVKPEPGSEASQQDLKPSTLSPIRDKIQQIIITKTADGDDDVFKKPLSAKNSEPQVQPGSMLKMESSDIEMLSAKSEDGKQQMSAMLTQEKTKENQEPAKEDKNKTISDNTKSLIKAAIKNASFKKRTDSQGDEEKPKPITAAMRQKEREDKRKKKKERTIQKKMKEKKKNSVDEILTSEDREMLHRWAKMQKVNVPIAPKPQTVGNSGQGQSVGHAGQGQMTPVQSNTDQITSQTQNNRNETHANGNKDKQNQEHVHSTSQKNVQRGTLDLLQQRILSNSSTNNTANTVKLPEQPGVSAGQINMYNTDSLHVENTTQITSNRIDITHEQNTKSDNLNFGDAGGDFSVDFSSVPLGDIDFLAMVTSPDLTSLASENMIQAPQNTSITSTHENYHDPEPLHTRRQSNGFSPSSLQQHGSPHHLSVSPNYPNHTSPPQYYQGHSPGSHHSVSPDLRVSPNFNYQQGNDLLPPPQHPTQMFRHQLNPQSTDIPFQGHNMLQSRNPADGFMMQPMRNQHQNQQNFMYRTQPLLQETQGSHSNSNSNSPPSLSINTQQAQMSFQHLFQPVAGPSHIDETQVDLIALLSKQLSKSNVGDLCPPLALTPRGTGGGYGLGVDLDALMGSTEADSQAEPSPLSSSILADWMEVTGNLNIDMDALEQELQSPMALSYNDLNLYSS